MAQKVNHYQTDTIQYDLVIIKSY